MADSNIGDLPNLSDVQDNALLVVEFQGKAYNLTGAQWKAYAIAAAQGVNKGEPGKDGVSPTVLVEDIEGGHRVTITDAAGVKTFDVLNGADGSGSGDMLKSAYDSDETVKTAGGIVAYVTAQIGTALEGSY